MRSEHEIRGENPATPAPAPRSAGGGLLRSGFRIALALLVFLGAVAAGLRVASQLAPERLRLEAQEILSRALGSPVRISHMRVGLKLGLGGGILFRGDGVSVWHEPAPDGSAGDAALRADAVEAQLDLWALLAGRLQLDRVSLDRARLRVRRAADGSWDPAALTPKARGPRSGERPHPRELLNPLIQLEGAVRKLLAEPLLADVLELRDSRIDWIDGAVPGAAPGDAPTALSLRGLGGRLAHPRLRGGAHVELRGRLYEGDAPRGQLEWSGARGRSGPIRMSLAARALDLGTLSSYLEALGVPARVEGVLTGTLAFETPRPGSGRLDLDGMLAALAARPTPGAENDFRPVEAESVALRLVLEITPDRAHLEQARLTSGDLDLQFEGVVARPLSPRSIARLSVSFSDVELAEALDHLGWLPAGEPGGPGRVEAGRLTALFARGTAPLSGWQSFFSGRGSKLPEGFTVDAELTGGRVRVGETDRLENLSAELHWADDRVRVTNGRAHLDGSPLPRLDLTLDGVSNLFATDPARRELSSGGRPLVGLRSFWEFLLPERDDESPEVGTTVWLEIASLEHPMFLWPIENAWAEIVPAEGGVHIEATKGTWGGAPIRGGADWVFEPDERVTVHVSVDPPDASETAIDQGFGWAHGRFAVGEIAGRAWSQKNARGAFSADGATVQLSDVEVELAPSGRLEASGSLDFGHRGAVPFEVELDLARGDVSGLAQLAGIEPGEATGSVDLSGRFRGELRTRDSFFPSLEGELSFSAFRGTLRREIPPFLAVALANDSLNPFAGRDSIRYHRIDSVLEFDAGTMRTDAFSLDGPDLRLMASGQVTLGPDPRSQAEVAVFLFRLIDKALERIPLVNLLLLGEDESILAAYYKLSGPWKDPEARIVPLRTVASGPASLVLERVPKMLRKGIDAIGSLLGAKRRPDPPAREGKPPARVPRGS